MKTKLSEFLSMTNKQSTGLCVVWKKVNQVNAGQAKAVALVC